MPSGNGAIFLVKVEVPSGYCDFDIEVNAEDSKRKTNRMIELVEYPGPALPCKYAI